MKVIGIIHLTVLFSKFANTYVIRNDNELRPSLYKRQEIPDLNGPPPEDSDHEGTPLLQSHESTEPTFSYIQQDSQIVAGQKRKGKSIFDSTGCAHHKNCEHWEKLSSKVRKKFQVYHWRRKLPEEKRKKMSREQTEKWRSKLTPGEIQRRKTLANQNRQKRLQEMPHDRREKLLAHKNAVSKAHYHNSELRNRDT